MLGAFFFSGGIYIYVILILAFVFLLFSIVIVPEKNDIGKSYKKLYISTDRIRHTFSNQSKENLKISECAKVLDKAAKTVKKYIRFIIWITI